MPAVVASPELKDMFSAVGIVVERPEAHTCVEEDEEAQLERAKQQSLDTLQQDMTRMYNADLSAPSVLVLI